jgi:hypothetical protein
MLLKRADFFSTQKLYMSVDLPVNYEEYLHEIFEASKLW